jgi:PAS domain S-box-containing protein
MSGAAAPAGDEAPPANRSAGETVTGWLQDIIPYGIFTTDRELRITRWNQWLVTHSGLTAGEVLGRPLSEVYPECDKPSVQSRYARALEGEIAVLSVALHKYLLPFPSTVPQSGTSRMLQTVRIAPLPGEGQVAGTITIIEDVTQREVQSAILNWQQEIDRLLSGALATLLQAQEPVAEVAAIFSAVVVALRLDSFVCYLLGPTGRQLEIQSSVGISPKQREGISALPLSEAELELFQDPAPPDGPAVPCPAPLAALGFLSATAFPLAVGNGLIGLVIFGSYQSELVSPAVNGVLARISRYVAIALDRSRRERDTVVASRAKDDFLAALSHELRTPLNPVLLVASDAATEPTFPEEARAAFRVIEKNALLEARLIDDLLDLTRIAHGKLALETEPVDIAAILRDALDTLRTDIAERELTLDCRIERDAHWVVGDAGRLQQVFWNVIKNAVKFTPRQGEIFISLVADRANNQVSITIADTGIGMEAAELARVFDAFAQGDHAVHGQSHRFGGLGLGLAISRKLIELHSGRIAAASGGKGRGSAFTIRLPLLAQNESPAPVPSESAAPAAGRLAGRTAEGKALRILLVEDHEATRYSLERLLHRRGYEVRAVITAKAAIDAAAAESFDLVLSDIGLPDESGFSLMRELRGRFGLRGIALTGYGMEEDMIKSSDAGFITHLTKPISVKVLEAALEKAWNAPVS